MNRFSRFSQIFNVALAKRKTLKYKGVTIEFSFNLPRNRLILSTLVFSGESPLSPAVLRLFSDNLFLADGLLPVKTLVNEKAGEVSFSYEEPFSGIDYERFSFLVDNMCSLAGECKEFYREEFEDLEFVYIPHA